MKQSDPAARDGSHTRSSSTHTSHANTSRPDPNSHLRLTTHRHLAAKKGTNIRAKLGTDFSANVNTETSSQIRPSILPLPKTSLTNTDNDPHYETLFSAHSLPGTSHTHADNDPHYETLFSAHSLPGTSHTHADNDPHYETLFSARSFRNTQSDYNGPDKNATNLASSPCINSITSTDINPTSTSSNKVHRRYSITTTNDFNVNISINNEATLSSSSMRFSDNSSLRSLSKTPLSKSSCYLSNTENNDVDERQSRQDRFEDICRARSASYLSGTQEEELNAIKEQNGGLGSSYLSKSTCYLSQAEDESKIHNPLRSNAISRSTCYLSQADDESEIHNTLSNARSRSTCYLSQDNDDPSTSLSNNFSRSFCFLSQNERNPSNFNKAHSGSLDSFYLEDGGSERNLSRTRVSIPPSSRNRNRSARPESFRVLSDMATHTRVLLKTRSFAEASLRESPKKPGGKSIMRTSLREEQFMFNREARVYQHSKADLLRENFASSDSCNIINNMHEFGDDETMNLMETTAEESVNVSINGVEKTALKTTQVLILDTYNSEEQPNSLQTHVISSKSEPPTPNISIDSHSYPSYNNPFHDGIEDKEGQCHTPPLHPYMHSQKDYVELEQYKTRLTITHRCSERENHHREAQRSSKLRAKSFTAIVSPRITSPKETTTLSISPDAADDLKGRMDDSMENICGKMEDAMVNRRGTKSFKITETDDRLLQSATLARKARCLREDRSLRFSSDLGFGAKPKSKNEVFV